MVPVFILLLLFRAKAAILMVAARSHPSACSLFLTQVFGMQGSGSHAKALALVPLEVAILSYFSSTAMFKKVGLWM